MDVVLNEWFSLPFLGREVYAELMKARVEHDKRRGFRITPQTNVSKALSILSGALSEQVVMAKTCFICDGPLYNPTSTDTEKSRERSICSDCESNEDAYDLYVMKFARLIETS